MKQSVAIRSFVTVAFLLAFLIVLPVVRADEWNQATLFTFSQPVQIPGQVLPAGTYLFELVNSFNHEIVRISNADRTNVIAVIQARPTPPSRRACLERLRLFSRSEACHSRKRS